jgi:hypothetical protein
MTLQKLIQLRQGTVAIKVFRDDGAGKLLFSLDKDLGSRKVLGPLFAEDELYLLLGIMLDYDEWESGAFHGIPNRRVRGKTAMPNKDAARSEIQAAIAEVARVEASASVAAEEDRKLLQHNGIQVLPSLPEYSYVHTCPKCGCHVASRPILPGGGVMSLCAWCNHVDSIEGV